MRLHLLILLIVGLLAQPAMAQSRKAQERKFRTWLAQTIWPQAQSSGVSRAVFDAALGSVTLDWSLPGTKDKPFKQAEFGDPARYFTRSQLQSTTAQGTSMARRHNSALARAAQTSGVPGHILLGIWGRESGFGKVAIRSDVFRVLATHGFMGRMPENAQKELLAALRIAQSGKAKVSAMKSNWAGALGQPQFLPSSFEKFARDGDGDGRADIWRSEADSLASIGEYLRHHGWNGSRDWGFEVRLPSDMSCTLEGPDLARPIRNWVDMGVARVSGRPFPAAELSQKGSLLLPAGRDGPAFIVTPNFYVLKVYNESDLYALFVGHVGDRIAYGSSDFTGRWPGVDKIKRADIAKMQKRLEAKGHDVGGADGLVGFKTRRSIGRWQEANGLRGTCWPDRGLVKKVR